MTPGSGAQVRAHAPAGTVDIDRILRRVLDEYAATPLAEGWPFREHEYSYRRLLIERGLQHLTKPAQAMLDIGAGRAIYSRFFKAVGARAITVDWPTTGGDALANARLAGIETHLCDVEHDPLPLPDNSVDIVYFADVIEHLHNSPRFIIEQIRRVLRPGGICVSSTPNSLRLTVRLKVLAGFSNWPRVTDFLDLPYHGGHHHEYTLQVFRTAFDRCGLPVVHFETWEVNSLYPSVESMHDAHSGFRTVRHGESLPVRLVRFAIRNTVRVAPSLRSEMVLVARKPA